MLTYSSTPNKDSNDLLKFHIASLMLLNIKKLYLSKLKGSYYALLQSLDFVLGVY